MRILIIDTDGNRRNNLRRNFEQNLFAVDVADAGHDGTKAAIITRYDAIVFCERAIAADMIEFCRSLRRTISSSVLLGVLADDEPSERTICLQVGADDCMSEPIALCEVVARVQALLRLKDSIIEDVIRVGDVRINLRHRSVRRGRKEVRLAPREYAILELLALRRGAIMSKAEIMESI